MEQPTAYVEIHKIQPCRNDTEFLEGYAWDTDQKTFQAFSDAKSRYSVSFEQARYLIDIFSEPDELVSTFPIAELGYRSLTKIQKR